MKIYSKIISTGSYLPKKILFNNELINNMSNINNEWIIKRTGIEKRHIAHKKYETTTNMGYFAALKAIKKTKINSCTIDVIIVATTTPDRNFPSTACIIQKKLNIKNCVAFDIQAACSGFIYALNVGNNFIISKIAKRVLIIGTETMSKITNWNDKKTCLLFGDGAGAIIIERSKYPGIITTEIQANGMYENILYVNSNTNKPYIIMNGNKIFKLATKYLIKIINKIFIRCNYNIKKINWFIPHQANIKIIKYLANNLNIPLDKMIITIKETANTSCASIPIALDYGINKKKIMKKQILLFKAFGAGLTWGITLVKY